MPTFEQVVARRDEVLRLAKRYRTGNVRVFGSVARGDARTDSDIDFLVTPMPDCSLLDLGGLYSHLEELFRCRIDLVPDDSIKPRLKDRILNEAKSI
jgi:hypothetical protein